MKTLLFFTLLLIAFSQRLCPNQKSCRECATGGRLSCRWCPKDGKCHTPGSLLTPCTLDENVRDPDWCECHTATIPNCCSCQPQRGLDPSICSYYTETTNSPNPKEWKGGDFLPVPYKTAATCACSGGGDPTWLTDSASCVRTHLRQLHIDLPDNIKIEMKKATDSGERTRFIPFLGLIKAMHDKAYEKCCCRGKTAPYEDWIGIFFAGDLLPCPLTIKAIKLEGRCGCGW